MFVLRLAIYLAIYFIVAKLLLGGIHLLQYGRVTMLEEIGTWALIAIILLAFPLPFMLADSHGTSRLGAIYSLLNGFKDWVYLCKITIYQFAAFIALGVVVFVIFYM